MEILPSFSQSLERDATPNRGDYGEIIELFSSTEFQELALSGEITVAMIRPQVGPQANLDKLPDLDAAALIEEQVEGLGVITKFSFVFDEDTIEEFYEGPSKESMKLVEPQRDAKYSNKWEEFKALMVSDPSTVLILFHPDRPIQKWREHLGHWNIEKYRDETTIRGRIGVDSFNNLVHGSDDPESVVREINLIKNSLLKYKK